MTSSRRWLTTIVAVLFAGSVLAIAPEAASAQGAPAEGLHHSWVQVSAGSDHTCGITTSGRLYCWGYDGQGRLGNGGANADRLTPTQVAGGGTDWIVVSAGLAHTCAIRSSGRLFCWGDNSIDQLGDGTHVDRHVPVPVIGGVAEWRSVSAGGGGTCAVARSRRLYCWGFNNHGQLGDDSRSSAAPYPSQVAGNAQNWASVSTGFSHTCALRTNGLLFCWGLDDHGQLGDGGANADRDVPARIGPASDWTAVTAGWSHTCGRRASGRLFCWGADDAGQVGNGGPDLSDQHRPVEVFGGATTWASVNAGTGHTCARQTSGRLFCWGWDGRGELGDGSPNFNQSIPVEVLGGLTTWAGVDAGGDHTCGRRGSGRLFCWGKDEQGQLGDGAPATDHASPVAVQ